MHSDDVYVDLFLHHVHKDMCLRLNGHTLKINILSYIRSCVVSHSLTHSLWVGCGLRASH